MPLCSRLLIATLVVAGLAVLINPASAVAASTDPRACSPTQVTLSATSDHLLYASGTLVHITVSLEEPLDQHLFFRNWTLLAQLHSHQLRRRHRLGFMLVWRIARPLRRLPSAPHPGPGRHLPRPAHLGSEDGSSRPGRSRRSLHLQGEPPWPESSHRRVLRPFSVRKRVSHVGRLRPPLRPRRR